MATLAERLDAAVAAGGEWLRAISDPAAGARPPDRGGWSKKEELGHLIDSATNNRVRFITAALAGEYSGPSYDGPGWVQMGGYAVMPWSELIETWTRLNRTLAATIGRIPEERLSVRCRVGEHWSGSLEALIVDYIGHMQHHLDHILAAQ